MSQKWRVVKWWDVGQRDVLGPRPYVRLLEGGNRESPWECAIKNKAEKHVCRDFDVNNPSPNWQSCMLQMNLPKNGPGASAKAQWIRRRLPICHPRFESQAHPLRFYLFQFELWHVEKTKRKIMGRGGLVVSVVSFFSDDLSWKRNKTNEKMKP